MKIMLDKGAFPPERAHPTDAGLDIRALHDGLIRAGQSATFHTGVHIELPPNTSGVLLPKSGLMVNHDLISFGVIDEPYRGEILVPIFNLGKSDYTVKAGDKISQVLIVRCFYEDVEVVNELSESDRGECGFGSTGYN